jgi:hypothetical protein
VSSTALVLAALVFTAGMAPADQPLPGVPAPELARLFTPQNAPDDSYQVNVIREPIEAARRTVMAAAGVAPDESRPGSAEPAAGATAGPWQLTRMDGLQAFGTGGRYDRSRLARLYRGRPVSVVRGPIERDGRTVAAVTMISPYPDATLTRLEEGTLVVLLDLSPGRGGR